MVAPWWRFPFDQLGSARNAVLGLAVIVAGTLLPFALIVSALRQLPSSRVAVVATLEPVLGAGFAYLLHAEALGPVQLAGGALVLGAVVWVQSQRRGLEAELAPARGARAPAAPSYRP